MAKETSKPSANSILRSAVSTLIDHPVIWYPFCLVAFVHLLALELLFFSVRFPLSIIFAPIVTKLWGPQFLHYPYNLQLLPNLFQSIQLPIFVLLSGYCIGVAISMLVTINKGKTVFVGKAMKDTLGLYIHLLVAALLTLLLVLSLFKLYSLVYDRATLIAAKTGIKFVIKQFIIGGAPFVNLLLSVIGSTLLAYLIPIIVIDRKNVFVALGRNFKVLFRSFFLTFLVIFLPSIIYGAVLLLRVSVNLDIALPEFKVLLLVLGLVVTTAIDAVVYTALSIFYLLRSENQ